MPGMILVPLDVAAQQHFKMISHYIVLLFYTTSSNGKESACNAGDQGLITGLGRSSGEGNGNPLQYSYLENFMDRGAWWATVCGVAKSWTRLSSSLAHTHTHTHTHTLTDSYDYYWHHCHPCYSQLRNLQGCCVAELQAWRAPPWTGSLPGTSWTRCSAWHCGIWFSNLCTLHAFMRSFSHPWFSKQFFWPVLKFNSGKGNIYSLFFFF